MALHLQTFRIGAPRSRGEGLRIGTVRLLPRGVPKREYSKRDLFDVWLPLVAPSRELLKAYNAGKLSPKRFFAKYRTEMKHPEARHTIELLAAVARRRRLPSAVIARTKPGAIGRRSSNSFAPPE